jgi:hypothetical protein
MIQRLNTLGFDNEEAFALRRIALVFDRWNLLECGTGDNRVTLSIERDEETGKPFLRRQYMGYNNEWQDIRSPYPDKEKGAQKRLAKIMAKHPELIAYEQGDPRGASLYIVRKSDLNGSDIHANYTKGVAVYR